jgi:uncharacterized iron-regulated membrane protein
VAAKLADWGIRMHMGFLFGLLNQLLLLSVAVGAVLTIMLGYRMWWQRRPTRGSIWSAGRPPASGALRRLPVWAAAVIVAVAVAVGWFLPVLGWSLAAFVVADLTAAAVRARRTGGGEDGS